MLVSASAAKALTRRASASDMVMVMFFMAQPFEYTVFVSIEIPLIVCDPRFLEKFDEFLAESLVPVVFLLVGDVFLYGNLHGFAHREGGKTHLPPEGIQGHGFRNPDRRVLFQIPQEIGQAMGGFESDKEVHMIRHTTDTLRNPAQTADSTAEVFVKARALFRRDQRLAVFRREDDVVEQLGVRGRNSVRGAIFFDN